MAGCFCGGGGVPCESTSRPELEGTRISAFGADLQHIAVCSGSWVRHGWIHIDELDRYDFRLEIDGIDIPLDRTDYCVPGDTPGSRYFSSTWQVQFPPDHFIALETYEFTGLWIDYEAPPGERVIYSNTIEMQPLICVYPLAGPEPEDAHTEDPPTEDAPPIYTIECADLTITSAEANCTCGWNQQQQFVCALEVEVVIANNGDASCSDFLLLLETSEGDVRRTLSGLAAGKSRRLTLSLPLDGVVCPLIYTVTVDAAGDVAECDESNNRVKGEVCCE